MPDIHWRIGEGSDQETIAKAAPTRRSRWSWLVIVIVVVLGAGLGVIYRSIPEPVPHPTPTITPLPPTETPLATATPPLPPGVANTVEQEAQALARGDAQSFTAVQDPDDADWQQTRSSPDYFNGWGTPPTGVVYTIVESGTLPNNRAWADVIQFRDGRRFRETRFYRLRVTQWVRTRPVADETFWGKWQTIQVKHFNLKFREKDMPLAVNLADQLEAAYQRVDRDLRYGETITASTTDQIIYHVTLGDGSSTPDQAADLELLSPRIAGFYVPESGDELVAQSDSFNSDVYHFLVTDLIERLATGGQRSGLQMTHAKYWWFMAISYWELARLGVSSPNSWMYLHTLDLPPLETLWGSPSEELLSAFIKFMAEIYGPEQVLKLVPQINTAPSLPEAIQQMGLSYTDLQQKWQVWIKQLVEAQS
ncbi:MAG TPA: hypothetical protein VMP08_09770 [Anaerolineae bacterium]|nr:hypothetical protein [Anaerolineae bacterium]